MRSSLRLAVVSAGLVGVCGVTAAQVVDPLRTFEGPAFRYRVVNAGTPGEHAVCEGVGGPVVAPESAGAQAATVPGAGTAALLGVAGAMSAGRRRR